MVEQRGWTRWPPEVSTNPSNSVNLSAAQRLSNLDLLDKHYFWMCIVFVWVRVGFLHSSPCGAVLYTCSWNNPDILPMFCLLPSIAGTAPRLPPKSPENSRLGVGKRRWGDIPRVVDLNQTKGFSVPYNVTLNSKSGKGEREKRTPVRKTYVLPNNHCMHWGPASQDMAEYFLVMGNKEWFFSLSLLPCGLCLFLSFFSL